jgi:two-component system chemotaxis response regulator CheY
MSLAVLVVDDSAVMRSMLIRTLRLSGLPITRVEQAGNGREALDLLERATVDLALVDLSMPILNGEEFVRHVREDERLMDLAIVVVSAEDSEARIQRLARYGAAFVRKPFTSEEIRATALRVLGVADA